MPMKLNIRIDYKTNDDTGNQFVAMFGGSAVPVQYESYRFPVRSPETFSKGFQLRPSRQRKKSHRKSLYNTKN